MFAALSRGDIVSINVFDAIFRQIRATSRPRGGRPWEYRFFLELRGHKSDEPLKTALAEAVEPGLELSILGSYPCLKEGDDGVS